MPGRHRIGCIDGRHARATLGAAAMLCTSALTALSQVPDPSSPGVPTASPPAISDRRSRPPLADANATQMLDLAHLNLMESRRETAQHVLEQLVARFPDTPEAARARADLLALYLRDPRIANPVPPPDGAAPPSPAATAASAWRISMMLAPTLQDHLRDTVGDRVFFPAGSTELGARARSVIAAQAQFLMKHPDLEATIEGHADDAALGVDDDVLSKRRAEAMLSHLVVEGVDPGRLGIAHHGSQARVATCADSDCAAQNRRAVLRIGARASHVVPAGADGVAPQADDAAGTRR